MIVAFGYSVCKLGLPLYIERTVLESDGPEPASFDCWIAGFLIFAVVISFPVEGVRDDD